MATDSTNEDPETYAIIGAAMDVQSELGQGFLEAVYQDAMAVELASHRIPFEREKILPVFYKGGILPSTYKADFLCYGSVLVECKAIQTVGKLEQAQIINYLRITRLHRAILLNFGARSLEYKRMILEEKRYAKNVSELAADISL